MVTVIPSTPDPWENELDERQQKHVGFCQNYVSRFGHGAPGHLDYTVIAALANLAQEQARQLAALDGSREQLAAYAHEAWSGWMIYLFQKSVSNIENGTVTIPKWAVDRWLRQTQMAYTDLPEDEKTSDRAEADKMLAIVRGV